MDLNARLSAVARSIASRLHLIPLHAGDGRERPTGMQEVVHRALFAPLCRLDIFFFASLYFAFFSYLNLLKNSIRSKIKVSAGKFLKNFLRSR